MERKKTWLGSRRDREGKNITRLQDRKGGIEKQTQGA